MMALSALDTACWDLAARAAGLPLFRYLGGDRTRVPAYASEGLWVDYSVDELLKEAAAFRAKGHRAMKMRIGAREHADDLERVRLLREAVGPDVKLLADVNQGWDELTAIRVGRRLQAHDVYWLEEPLPYEDLEGCARAAAALDMRVASGETEYGSLGMKRHLVTPEGAWFVTATEEGTAAPSGGGLIRVPSSNPREVRPRDPR